MNIYRADGVARGTIVYSIHLLRVWTCCMYIHRTDLGHAGVLLQLRSRSTFLQSIFRVQRSPGTLFVILFFLLSPLPFPSFSLSPRMVRSFLTIVLTVILYSSPRSVDH
ncbi:hypothetical protein BDV36DRAFT_114840 [Aspergillus pseudocaelatus]|uniref:Uncharacterized protein n=1 Tax=Aspergillus pseudocaelatus TaxID=1825620 RepID=A0ABQ6WUG5_9EURO|nr:hypothetical protein BDV36DRAFT_114840 [Aspergillus pseudocaelatus]